MLPVNLNWASESNWIHLINKCVPHLGIEIRSVRGKADKFEKLPK